MWEDNHSSYPGLGDMGRMWGCPPALLDPEKRPHSPTMLGYSNFSGQCSCSLLEITGMVLPPAGGYQAMVAGRYAAFVPSLSPASQATCPMAPHQPALHGLALPLAPGCLESRLAWDNAVLGHLSWVLSALTLPCPPRLAQSNALGMFITSTALSGTTDFQEIVWSFSSFCQPEFLEAFRTLKNCLILCWIKPY